MVLAHHGRIIPPAVGLEENALEFAAVGTFFMFTSKLHIPKNQYRPINPGAPPKWMESKRISKFRMITNRAIFSELRVDFRRNCYFAPDCSGYAVVVGGLALITSAASVVEGIVLFALFQRQTESVRAGLPPVVSSEGRNLHELGIGDCYWRNR